jgi:hypothetical protein
MAQDGREKLSRYEWALLSQGTRSLASSWPKPIGQPKRKAKRKRKGPSLTMAKGKVKRLTRGQRAQLHGWISRKVVYTNVFNTLHMRVSPNNPDSVPDGARVDSEPVKVNGSLPDAVYGRGVIGAFGQIVGDPTAKNETYANYRG